MVDVKKIKSDFPVLKRRINGKKLVYLDSAATSQKPQPVIGAVVDYYQNHNANIHRGVHTLGDESTRLYESARKTVANFIGAADPDELIFVRNATEAINLVAYAWGRNNIKAGDEILVSEMEHHSNLVPWQMLAKEKKAAIKFIRVSGMGSLNLNDLKEKLSPRTKIVSIVHVSNFLGTINPIYEIARIINIKRPGLAAARPGLKIPSTHPLLLVDGAQAVPHMPVNVKDLGCDFYAFSGHKMYGPMGIGCLWGRKEILEKMPPFLTGGGMINTVSFKETTFTGLPDKFEAGTPNVAGAVGLAAAVKYLKKIGMENVRKREMELTEYAIDKLCKGLTFAGQRPGLIIQIFGPADVEQRGGLIAFTVKVGGKEIHAHDVAQVLDSEGIAVRSGHHCVMPMHTKLGLSATTRASFGIYNTKEDVDKLISALSKVKEVFN